ncbi:MAG: hypothetical protein G3M70_08045 [Candidatus Nitronauta litoralis]|uniref:Uncharacterized protein n=1 Tax=Candidatus Nitronauta litoralis TaxID=2705533 RepID=A0A7T0BVN3_9BACT|nr:MAG: hypothetical protein G3M70_08045 [Candidatus Nitronauta litoralis]
MKFLDKKRLIKLLSETSSLPNLNNLKEIENYEVTTGLSGRYVTEIYTRRFETAGNDYDGFSELINLLPKLSDEKIKIHTFDLNSKHLFFFTDPKTKTIYGSLIER